MANSVLQTCCFIVLTVLVERGDGRWKKKDENIQHDIELFNRMADKIQNELEDTYDEYSSRRIREQIFFNLLQKYSGYTAKTTKNFTKYEVKSSEPHNSKLNNNDNLQKDSIQNYIDEVKSRNDVISDRNVRNIKLGNLKTPKWPKFEEILLEIGKKYDWKNDRWMKVKGKLKTTDVDNISDNSLEFLEKHKFYYRIVKLNKSKNRRNVVVAVSAVR